MFDLRSRGGCLEGMTLFSPRASHINATVFEHYLPQRLHTFGSFVNTKRHTIDATIFTQPLHILWWGPGAVSPRPTFVERSRGTNIVGHYILSTARRG